MALALAVFSAAAPSGCAIPAASARHRARFSGRPHAGGRDCGGTPGTVGEAGLLHFRGTYHDPFMLLRHRAARRFGPASCIGLRPHRTTHRLTRWWLR